MARSMEVTKISFGLKVRSKILVRNYGLKYNAARIFPLRVSTKAASFNSKASFNCKCCIFDFASQHNTIFKLFTNSLTNQT